MVKVLIKKLDSKVQLPKYKTDGSSGMDLMASLESPINLKPQESALIPTEYQLQFLKIQRSRSDQDQDLQLNQI